MILKMFGPLDVKTGCMTLMGTALGDVTSEGYAGQVAQTQAFLANEDGRNEWRSFTAEDLVRAIGSKHSPEVWEPVLRNWFVPDNYLGEVAPGRFLPTIKFVALFQDLLKEG